MDHKIPKEDSSPARNVRGKKTRNPGYEPGNHWIACERCGHVIRSEDAKKEWTGLWVCPDDWEIRHPQDFVRGRYDDIAAKEPNRPEPPDRFAQDKDVELPDTPEYETPEGTFDNSL